MTKKHQCFLHTNGQEKHEQLLSAFFHHNDGKVTMRRPNTSLTKTYTVDGVLYPTAQASCDFYDSHIRAAVRESVASRDCLIWTFGTSCTSPDFFDMLCERVGVDVLDQAQGNLDKDVERTIVSVSILGFSGDHLDRAVDCLAADENTPPLRVRENTGKGSFYMENCQEVILASADEIAQVLKVARASILDVKRKFNTPRMHVLVTYTARVIFFNGDAILSEVSLMDVCGADRQKMQSAPKTRATKAKSSKQGGNKDDRTLKAMHRIIDTLSSGNARHIPFRDSKITRLVGSKLSPQSSAFNFAFLRLDAGNEASYDEASAVLELSTKIKSIYGSDEPLTAESERENRQLDMAKEEKAAAVLADRLGLSLDGLASKDIALDMSSPDDLVALQSALARIESLRHDPHKELERVSSSYWARQRQ